MGAKLPNSVINQGLWRPLRTGWFWTQQGGSIRQLALIINQPNRSKRTIHIFCSHEKSYRDKYSVTYCFSTICLKWIISRCYSTNRWWFQAVKRPLTAIYSFCYEYFDGASKSFDIPYYSINSRIFDYIITETNEESFSIQIQYIMFTIQNSDIIYWC